MHAAQFGGWALGGVFLPTSASPHGMHTPGWIQQSCVLDSLCAAWHLTKGHFGFLAFFQRFDLKACFEAVGLEDEAAFPRAVLAQQIGGMGSAHFTEMKLN